MLGMLFESMYTSGSKTAVALGSGLAGIVKGYTSGHGDTITPQAIDNLLTYGPVAMGAAYGAVGGGAAGFLLGGRPKDVLTTGTLLGALYAGFSVLSQAAGFGIGYAASKII